ncbi:MAG TPA: carbohydrate porin [Xanthobacteraceae bacterium]|nr:carbohydrate porin [Xanthobacteraceae bacterium]
MKSSAAIARKMLALALAIAANGFTARAALADDADDRMKGFPSPLPTIATSLPGQDFRKSLSDRGINYGFVYTGEVLSNTSGGVRRGTIYEDLLETYVAFDLEKIAGLKGLSFYSNQFWISGTGNLGSGYVGGMITISNIEALPTGRLSEIWFQQKFLDDKLNVRVGQLTTDAEFFNSRYFTLFINSDWPTITSQNLPSGGPAYPLSTPGIRFKYQPNTDWVFLLGLFNGDPSGVGFSAVNPQVKNPHGLNFRLNDPPLLIGEAQYSYNQHAGLAGTLRLGAWHHFGHFNDQEFGTDGLSLANPLSNGMPRQFLGDDGIYGIIDQQIYRPPGATADKGIALFSRISGSPSDRNLIDFYADGGIVFNGMVPGRPNDNFGASVIYAHVSSRASALDRDQIAFSGMPFPIRNYEMTLDFTYQFQILPGWTVQPDFQYVFHPGGNIPDPNAALPTTTIKNAMIFGIRTDITY